MCSINNAGGCADAVKICLDHSVGVALAPENPPPLFLCQECATRLQHEQTDAVNHLYDVLQPIQQFAITCENKVRHEIVIYIYLLYLRLVRIYISRRFNIQYAYRF